MTLADSPSIGALAGAAARDVHPPLYFILLGLWRSVFSGELAASRALSAVFSLVALIPFWRWARALIGPRGALLATGFVALSPFHLWYAQEVRMYALLVLLEATMLWVSFRVIDDASHSSRRWWFFAALCILTTALIYTHFFSVFVLGFVGCYWLVRLLCDRKSAELRLALLWAGWAALSLIPALLQMTSRMRSGQGIDWLPPLSFDSLLGIRNAFSYGVWILPRPYWIIFILGPAALLLMVSALLAEKESTRSATLDPRLTLFLLLAFTFVLPLLVSLFRPIVFFGQRYLIIATLPFYALLALGCLRLAERARFVWLLPLLLFLAGMVRYHVDYFDSRQKRTFDRAAEYIAANAYAGDAAICVHPVPIEVLSYYLDPAIPVEKSDGTTVPEFLRGHRGGIWLVSFQETRTPLEERIAGQSADPETAILEIGDVPGLMIRLTRYEAN